MRGPGGRRPMGGKRSKNPKKTLNRLMKYIGRDYGIQFGVVLICIALSAVANVAGSMFLKSLIDDYVAPLLLQASPVFTQLIHALMGMAVIYFIGIGTTFLYNWLMVGISQGVLKRVRDDMFEHMQTLPIRYFDTHTHGDLMSHFTNDTDTLQQMLSQSVPQMFSSAMTIISVFIGMLVTNVWLTLFVLLGIAVMLVVVRSIGGRSARFFLAQQTSLGKVNGYIEEMINGQKVIKVFCHEDKCREQFDTLNDELRQAACNANTFANILMPIMGNIGNLLYVLVAVVGGALALSGVVGDSITIGVIASFLQLTKSFTMPVTQISQQFNFVLLALAGAERVFKLMDVPPEIDDGDVALGLNAHGEKVWRVPNGTESGANNSVTEIPLAGMVELHDVTFSYDGKVNVLNDVSLYAKRGQKIAFVGSTGAGKTTITNLINRFYDVNEGEITYDGIDVRRIKKRDLRGTLGMVLQDTHLFTGTVMENIRYGKLDATDEECIQAAKIANAHYFISHLPNGYDTMLTSDGANLSQGQRQLIAIARAAVTNPEVLILDEATSSIDTRTELLIERGMDSLMEGRTVFVIAHRLSTVRNSNAIMVLEKGRIIERGDHEELLRRKGRYYELYTGMFELS